MTIKQTLIEEFFEKIKVDPNEVVMYHFTQNEEGESIYIEEILKKFERFLKKKMR